ncbi:hypothetical protein STRTUCAR8_08584 [Streptomyces turgidiscabies Car8]|uniref:Uncharacterized protein n=1 Tax=Streptomyces turgidiscabies (strain Car8) TaxID=698760 RepID=L7F7R6_STRT8|nr:hypothetical protein [Streptomyces turgidiscabies]ELP67623.1 hypothetical protein STRTUCAR8_08584 [Streptomyces turgidiscabies Car8]
MLIAVLCLAALAPGAATAWLLRERGTLIAVLAGAGVTVSLPFLLACSLVAFPPLGVAIAAVAALAALKAYDDGRVWIGTAWTAAMLIACACAGWPR